MANYKRRRPRTAARHSASARFPRGAPRWWDIIFHTRRKRALTKHLERRLMQGDDPEAIAWPVSKNKPTIYYW